MEIMSKRIEVVFIKDIENVAKRGQRQTVAAGFWRNYLSPRGLALISSDRKAKELIKDRETSEMKQQEVQTEGVEISRKVREERRTVRQEQRQEKKVKESKKAARLKARVEKGKG